MFFHKSYLPTEEYIGWVFETYEWFLKNLGGWDRFARTELILPTQKHYPLQSETGHALAEQYLKITKTLAHMEDWPCVLEPQKDVDVGKMMGDMPHSISSSGAAGTFSVQGEGVVITYSEADLENPVALIATMAHELGHFLFFAIPDKPPGGKEGEEPATDAVAQFLGFGLFQCNTALQFKAYQDYKGSGYMASRTGYLDERQMAYTLALFCVLHGTSLADVRKHLTGNPKTYIKAAFKDLKGRADKIDGLRNVSAVQSWPKALTHESSTGMAKYYCMRGWPLMFEEKHDQAIEIFGMALRISPDYVDALIGRGQAYIFSDQKERAYADYDQAIKVDPKSESAFCSRGSLFTSDGEHERAMDDLTTALTLKPDWGAALRTRAEIHLALGDVEAALQDAESCLELDPEDLSARKLRASLFQEAGRCEEGVEELTVCLRSDPDDDESLRLRAKMYIQLERFEEAIQDYSKMLLQNPFEMETLLARAQAYTDNKEMQEAVADCDQILEQDPEHKIAQELRAKALAT